MIYPIEIAKTTVKYGSFPEPNKRCQICGSSSIKRIIDLGEQPICNALLDCENAFQEEAKYPLALDICQECSLVQLSDVPPSEVVFNKNFNYVSGSTKDIVEYFGKIAEDFIRNFNLNAGDLVVDIGSNDGTLLNEFRSRGMGVLGIEPAPIIAKMANEKGIETINGRFEDSIQEFRNRLGGRSPRIILAFNVLAHTDTPDQFMREVSKIVKEFDSIFVSQSHYLGNLVDKCEYDTIYHEHARYYSLNSLRSLHHRHKLWVFDARLVDFYGGSILAFAKGNFSNVKTGMAEIVRYEDENLSDEQLDIFAHKVYENREKLVALLSSIKKEGKHIVGIGAPMKSSTLLNFCGISNELVDYLTEVNPLKVGKFSPGMHIPICDESRIFLDQPDYALILSWNVAKTIIGKLKRAGYRGKFIIPIPEPEVVS